MSPNTSRTLLVTLLGAFARRTGDWMPVKGIVQLLEVLGVDESSTRTGVSRLKKRGWLEPEKREGRSGYRITAAARASFAAGDEVIWHARQPAQLEDGWCVATFSVPEQQRAKRHLLRSRLVALGFGNVGSGVWIAPARMENEALRVVEALNLNDNTNIFVGRYVGGQDLRSMVAESWDLAAIDEGYRTFIARFQPGFTQLLAAQPGELTPLESYTHYLCALDAWRFLPMRDPGLPRELLSEDWQGEPATQLLEEMVTALEDSALEYVREVIDS